MMEKSINLFFIKSCLILIFRGRRIEIFYEFTTAHYFQLMSSDGLIPNSLFIFLIISFTKMIYYQIKKVISINFNVFHQFQNYLYSLFFAKFVSFIISLYWFYQFDFSLIFYWKCFYAFGDFFVLHFFDSLAFINQNPENYLIFR